MPNRPPTVEDLTVEDLVRQVKARLVEIDRTPAWLAKQLSVPDSTLRWWLNESPESLRVPMWLRMLHVLGITWADVVALTAKRSVA